MDPQPNEGRPAGRPSSHPPPGLGELARTFLRISLLGFGGPNAHLALMLDEVVERRRWITREHFLQLMAVTNLLPGPNSSEVAIHVGYTQRGWPGALTTGLAFLLPTFVMVTGLSWAYFGFGTLPAVEPIFWGLKPAVLAVIVAAGVKLGRTAVTGPLLALLAVMGAVAAWGAGSWVVAAMAAGGAVTWLRWRAIGGDEDGEGIRTATGAAPSEEPTGATGGPPPDRMGADGRRGGVGLLPMLSLGGLGALGSVFWTHLWIGSVLFGGGYVLVVLLEPQAVDRFGWLTSAQFLDGVALTQAVPGPISTLSAFVGYAAAGVPGAVLGTAGVYLPAFLAVLLVAPHLDRWRGREPVARFLAGVSAVVAGAIVGVAVTLVGAAVPDAWAAVALAAALLALALRAPALAVVLGGVAVGVVRLLLT